MAFGAEELRVLRRALALALHPGPASAEDVQDCHRLAESLDEAMREAARLRAFLVADLARYRAALPGTVTGYLALLEEVLAAGHRPVPDDLAALRALRGNPAAAALLARCQVLAEQDVRARLARRTAGRSPATVPMVPASRTPLLALPGGRSAATRDEAGARIAVLTEEPAEEPRKKPAEKPPAPGPGPVPVKPAPEPARRPVPTPGEVFPRRKPTPPPGGPQERLAAG
jgi:predicted RNase H-like HicB family nuclease